VPVPLQGVLRSEQATSLASLKMARATDGPVFERPAKLNRAGANDQVLPGRCRPLMLKKKLEKN